MPPLTQLLCTSPADPAYPGPAESFSIAILTKRQAMPHPDSRKFKHFCRISNNSLLAARAGMRTALYPVRKSPSPAIGAV